ncbi:MAG: hypothetical protein PHP52_11790 [Bacteroidales bacterium]|nr:hypothetical protein [Bacteroidales bacterium]MDD4218054.1 hypothetical protein [Bacteroidales bacterium]
MKYDENYFGIYQLRKSPLVQALKYQLAEKLVERLYNQFKKLSSNQRNP